MLFCNRSRSSSRTTNTCVDHHPPRPKKQRHQSVTDVPLLIADDDSWQSPKSVTTYHQEDPLYFHPDQYSSEHDWSNDSHRCSPPSSPTDSLTYSSTSSIAADESSYDGVARDLFDALWSSDAPSREGSVEASSGDDRCRRRSDDSVDADVAVVGEKGDDGSVCLRCGNRSCSIFQFNRPAGHKSSLSLVSRDSSSCCTAAEDFDGSLNDPAPSTLFKRKYFRFL